MVAVGLTDRVPDVATAPMLWSIETVVALVVAHVRVANCPDGIDCGEALNVAVGGGTTPSGAIGHVRPLIPARVVGVQLLGGLGRTTGSLW